MARQGGQKGPSMAPEGGVSPGPSRFHSNNPSPVRHAAGPCVGPRWAQLPHSYPVATQSRHQMPRAETYRWFDLPVKLFL